MRTPIDMERAAALYAEGYSIREVARMVGGSRSSLGRALVAAGVELRPSGGWTHERSALRHRMAIRRSNAAKCITLRRFEDEEDGYASFGLMGAL